MVSTLIFLPLFSFIACIFFGAKVKREKGLKIFISSTWAILWLITLLLFSTFINSEITLNITYLEWIKVGTFNLKWEIELNKVTLTMSMLIISISSLVHIFSLNYMSEEPHLSRFMAYLSLFTFFMFILVFSTNLIQLFIGWEGVGVCSYLLINFWSTRLMASQSAFKAMVVNKIGDMALLISIGILIKMTGTPEISTICSLLGTDLKEIKLEKRNVGDYSFSEHILLKKIALLLILIAVVGKSAQVGLHMWLPDAMEGPTPVSALIHAATMVTAGVFLIIKLSPVVQNCYFIHFLIILIGSITCLMAAAIGSTQSDLKKIIAYSTCSQLGYMVMVCGYGYYSVSLFHLFNHGIFKALLFLSAGLIIHSLFNEQNLIKMGLKKISPIGKSGFIIGNFAIVGFPFLTGYYSKDLFLELIASKNLSFFPIWLGYIAASLTCFYSLKLFWISYNKGVRYPMIFRENFHNNSPFLIVPLLALGLGSIFIGFLLFKNLNDPIRPIIVSSLLKQIPVIILVLVFLVSFFCLHVFFSFLFKDNFLNLCLNGFYFNELVGKTNIKASYNKTYKLIDTQLVEWLTSSKIKEAIIKLTSFTSIFKPIGFKAVLRNLIFFLPVFLFILFF